MHKYSIHSNNHAYLQHNSSSQYPNQHDFVFIVVHACTWLHMINQSDDDDKSTKTFSDSEEDAYSTFWKVIIFNNTEWFLLQNEWSHEYEE